MILITGATGNLGKSVVAQLAKNISKDSFVVTSSNQKGVEQLSKQGLNARLANFNDEASLKLAFQGISKLLLISTMEANRLEQHKNVVDAAKEQGVSHIVYTSLAIQNIETSAVRDLMQSHFETEDYIKASGLPFTILRNTMYAEALVQILGNDALIQDIKLPAGAGSVPFALRTEMGEAIANLLLQSGHENKIFNIGGLQNIGFAEIASELSQLTGRDISYTNIDAEVFRHQLLGLGFPDFAIYLHAGTLEDVKTHQYEIESNVLEQLLGRQPANVNEMMKVIFLLK